MAETYTDIRCEMKGGPGRRARWRVAVATCPEILQLNGASRDGREAIAAGKLAIDRAPTKAACERLAVIMAAGLCK